MAQRNRTKPPLDQKWTGGRDANQNEHAPPWDAVLASLEDFAESCGWPSLAAMKRSVLRSRGLLAVPEEWKP